MPFPLRAPADRLRVLVTGYLVRRPVGGLAWHYLQYVLGLAELGHDVFYIEDSEDYPSCFDPSTRREDQAGQSGEPATFERQTRDPSYGLTFVGAVFDRLGLPERWAYYDGHQREWLGPGAGRMPEICASADVVINVSNSISLRPWLRTVPVRILIDTDPVFGQLRHIHVPGWLERTLAHNVFLTYGENYQQAGCSIPVDGLPWRPTRQPVVLSRWPKIASPEKPRLTSVMSWKSYDAARDGDRRYGLKSDSFAAYLDLPGRVGCELQLAIDAGAEARATLKSHGWGIRDALAVTRDPWTYQEFIQASSAELGIAKQAYVSARSGWFSERSAVYLASGRPVIVQETGFSDWLNVDLAVLPFSSPEEAVGRIEELLRDYKAHESAAREVASEFFGAEKVLQEVLDQGASHCRSGVFRDALVGEGLLARYEKARSSITAVVPPGEPFVLIDDNQLGIFGQLDGRACLPFLERDGLYWGQPDTDRTAIRELERLRESGVHFLALAWPAFWWPDHYVGLFQHLEARFARVRSDAELKIYDLRGAVGSTAE